MDDLGAIFSLNNWPGHLSYVLIAISYWLTDMFWLRVVAVVGLTLEILYFWLSGGDLRTRHRIGSNLHQHKPLPDISACEGSPVAALARA